jgi:hypothetical protein
MKVDKSSKKIQNKYIIIGTLLALGGAYLYLREQKPELPNFDDNKLGEKEKFELIEKLKLLENIKKYEIDKKNTLIYRYLGFSGIY